MQIIWYAVALAAIGLAIRPVGKSSSRLVAAFLAAYYVWLGIVFFGIFYNTITPALVDGAMFLFGGVLFLIAGVVRSGSQVSGKVGSARRGWRRIHAFCAGVSAD